MLLASENEIGAILDNSLSSLLTHVYVCADMANVEARYEDQEILNVHQAVQVSCHQRHASIGLLLRYLHHATC